MKANGSTSHTGWSRISPRDWDACEHLSWNSTLISQANIPERCQNRSEFDSTQRTRAHLSGSQFKEAIRKVWRQTWRSDLTRGSQQMLTVLLKASCCSRSDILTDFQNHRLRTHFYSGLDQWSLCVCLDLRSENWTELHMFHLFLLGCCV